ncbi:hypothetical protein GALL_414580 [mine drainage metagenome]|uniref:Uncharacterized protein n=1 Tax=mine drainage metagenome TaxID=410659 RepID=A0A1J5Q0J3_9ZZZZ
MGRRLDVRHKIDADMHAESGVGRSGVGKPGAEFRQDLVRLDELEKRALDVRVRHNGCCADRAAICKHDAPGHPLVDQDALYRSLEMDFAATRFDGIDEDVGQAAGTADGIVPALEVIAEDRRHLCAGQFFRPIAEIA